MRVYMSMRGWVSMRAEWLEQFRHFLHGQKYFLLYWNSMPVQLSPVKREKKRYVCVCWCVRVHGWEKQMNCEREGSKKKHMQTERWRQTQTQTMLPENTQREPKWEAQLKRVLLGQIRLWQSGCSSKYRKKWGKWLEWAEKRKAEKIKEKCKGKVEREEA